MYSDSTLKIPKIQPENGASTRTDRVSGSAASCTLSKAHICPQDIGQFPRTIDFYMGGQRMTIHKPHYKYQGVHTYGDRGVIKKFSWQSRRRLLYKIAEINTRVLPVFATLTYPKVFPDDPVKWKSDLTNLFKRLQRKYPQSAMIWKLEPQERGAPHYHLLIWGVPYEDLYSFIPSNWYDIAGGGDPLHLKWHWGLLGNGNTHCVSRVRSWRGVMAYASKYMGKVCDNAGWDSPGRFWGVKSRENIPWAEIVKVAISYKDGYKFIRLMRHYAHLPSMAFKGLTIFCNPNFWYDNLPKILNSM